MTNLYLDLLNNNIGENGAKMLSNSLGKITKITSLNLNFYGNDIGDNGTKFLAEGIGKLS